MVAIIAPSLPRPSMGRCATKAKLFRFCLENAHHCPGHQWADARPHNRPRIASIIGVCRRACVMVRVIVDQKLPPPPLRRYTLPPLFFRVICTILRSVVHPLPCTASRVVVHALSNGMTTHHAHDLAASYATGSGFRAHHAAPHLVELWPVLHQSDYAHRA